MRDIEVYVENLRSYTAGKDRGQWITLGIDEKELQQILTKQVGLTENYPDMAIFDYNADFKISEYENIYDLNQLAVQLKQMPEHDYIKVMEYCQSRDILTALEMSNVCQQIDEIPYQHFPDWIDKNIVDPEEKLGYALFENNSELATTMRQMGMEDYFDYKAYGRDESINTYELCDHGFINRGSSIDLGKYSYEEIQDQLKEQINSKDQENSFDGSEKYKEENTWESEENFWSDEASYEQETYMASDNETMVEEDIEVEITMND